MKLAVNNFKICNFSSEKIFLGNLLVAVKNFHRILLAALKKFFSPISAGRSEKFSFTAYAVKKIQRLNFSSPHLSHWAHFYTFYSNSPQILHLLAIFSGPYFLKSGLVATVLFIKFWIPVLSFQWENFRRSTLLLI